MGESTLGVPRGDEPPRAESAPRCAGSVRSTRSASSARWSSSSYCWPCWCRSTFLTAQNFINVSRQASYVGIMAVGMVFVIAMGDIDLSVGSIWMLSSVMMAIALRDGYPIWIAVAICMLVATLCGLLNGALSVALGIPTIIVTLGTLSLYRGLGLVVTKPRRSRDTT